MSTTWGHDRKPDRTEPLWWGLFAAGGGLTALFVPAQILFQYLLGAGPLPVATESYERTRRLAANPLVRLYLAALVSLSLFHWAHRFRYYVMDFGVLGARRLIAVLCYGSAIVGALSAARTLLRLPGPGESAGENGRESGGENGSARERNHGSARGGENGSARGGENGSGREKA